MIYSILCKQCVTEDCRNRGVWPANERCGSYSPNAHFKPIAEANAVARMNKASNVPGIFTAIGYGDTTFIRPYIERVEPKFLKNCESCAMDIDGLCDHHYTGKNKKFLDSLEDWIWNNWDNKNACCKPGADNCPGWKGKE